MRVEWNSEGWNGTVRVEWNSEGWNGTVRGGMEWNILSGVG